MKRIPWFEIILVIAVMSMSLYAALSDPQNLSMRWFIRDDAYYYFKVAQNISEGHGSTFDGINPTNGYHPLWLWVCIPIFALARFDLILPLRILLLVMSGFSVATAIMMYRLLGKVFTPAIGAIAAVYWVFSQDVLGRVYKQGLETGIASFFIMLLVYKLYDFETSWRNQAITKKQLAILGIIATLVMFSRLDLAFFAGMVGIWIVFRKSPIRYLLPLDVVAILVSVLLAFVIRIPFKDYLKYSDVAVLMIALSLAVKVPTAYLFNLYQRSVVYDIQTMFKNLIRFSISTSIIIGMVMMVVSTFARFEGFPRTVILNDMIITALLFGITRIGVHGLETKRTSINNEQSVIKQFTTNWGTWISEGTVFYGIVFGTLALYMLWNKLAFGTFSPVSGQIKRWWGSLSGNVYGGSASNVLTFFGIAYKGDGNAWSPVSKLFGNWAKRFYTTDASIIWFYLISILLFALLLYIILLINKQKAKTAIVHLSIIPLFSGSWIQVISYHATGYASYKEWYWVSQLILVVLALAMVLGMLYQPVRKHFVAQTAVWLFAIGVGLFMGASFWQYIKENMTYSQNLESSSYNEIATFLEEHTEPGSVIGMTGGGNAGYFISNRTIINMDGLINSYDYFKLLQNKEAGKYLGDIGMNYILANSDLLEQLPYKGQFTPYIEWMDIRYGGKDLMRYHATPQP